MIFHNKKVIFLHIPKTAGTSIEEFFDKEDRDHNKFYPDVVWGLKDRKYTQHFRYESIKKYYEGDEDIERYFKFTFVRNTWDRLLSAYSYLNPNPDKEKFCSYIQNRCINFMNGKIYECEHYDSQINYVLQNGKEFLDFIGRFENIQEDFKKLCEKLNINYSKLPFTNVSNRRKCECCYDKKTIEIVGEAYKEEIKYFNFITPNI
jgi:hypothetical protein